MNTGINNTYLTDPKKVHTRFGQNYFKIDFLLNTEQSEIKYETEGKSRRYYPIGELQIGDRTIQMTLKEIEKLKETIYEAELTYHRMYKLGLLK
tara:strand:- start:412 stop:693 length:282 start_codon:yes stop_codon:yes gene_type:complete